MALITFAHFVLSEDHTGEKARKGSILALKARADVTKVQNKGIGGPTKRTHVLQIFLKNYGAM